MTGRILRYEVPVDDEPHTIDCGPVLHVASRDSGVVELWANFRTATLCRHTFQVFETGQPIPNGWEWVGTALPTTSDALVWHLHELADQ